MQSVLEIPESASLMMVLLYRMEKTDCILHSYMLKHICNTMFFTFKVLNVYRSFTQNRSSYNPCCFRVKHKLGHGILFNIPYSKYAHKIRYANRLEQKILVQNLTEENQLSGAVPMLSLL
jgi:hypothetical protein